MNFCNSAWSYTLLIVEPPDPIPVTVDTAHNCQTQGGEREKNKKICCSWTATLNLGVWMSVVVRIATLFCILFYRASAGPVAPIPDPVFLWLSIPEMWTCKSAPIFWSFENSESLPMYISITNAGVTQAPKPSATSVGHVDRSADPELLTMQISGLLDAAERTFTWAQANVTEGWYALIATFLTTSALQVSSPFFVNEGDISCLSTTTNLKPKSSAPGSIMLSPSSAFTPASSTVSSSPTTFATKTSHVELPEMLGGVFGGILIGGLFVAGLFKSLGFIKRRRTATSSGSMDRNQSRFRPGIRFPLRQRLITPHTELSNLGRHEFESQSSSFGTRIARNSSDANLVDLRRWFMQRRGSSQLQNPFDTPAGSVRQSSSSMPSYQTISSNCESASTGAVIVPPSPAYPSGSSLISRTDVVMDGMYNMHDPALLPHRSDPS
ncbi:hypothetical protein MIND_01221900 [Mycena indigotica]|uniref:Transmembrane protein n=1 Tax=Mycena indigotica TaxID=2126181 RepID=A0A8H6VVT4_9AGAR|nr:uncharacterized protein MIND_01221900 [Mycena indigotica]KAF7291963.1 hypothetical protein MIND_01221900 [Mycena indigotica]